MLRTTDDSTQPVLIQMIDYHLDIILKGCQDMADGNKKAEELAEAMVEDYIINTPLSDRYTTRGTRILLFKITDSGSLELVVRKRLSPELPAYRELLRIQSTVWERISPIRFELREMTVSPYCTEAQFYEDYSGADFKQIQLPEGIPF